MYRLALSAHVALALGIMVVVGWAAFLQVNVAHADPDQRIVTLLGHGVHGVPADGETAFYQPATHDLWDVVLDEDSGALYVVDKSTVDGSVGCGIRKIDDGVVTRVAGTGACGHSGTNVDPLTATMDPYGAAIDSQGNLYIADVCWVRKVDFQNNKIVTVAGNTFMWNGDFCTGSTSMVTAPATQLLLRGVYDVAIDEDDNLWLSEQNGCAIRKVEKSPDAPAGDGNIDGDADEIMTAIVGCGAGFRAISIADGNLHYARGGGIWLANGTATPTDDLRVAGTGTSGWDANDESASGGSVATHTEISGYTFSLRADANGNLYFSDTLNCRVRKVTTGGDGVVDGQGDERVQTLIGSGTCQDGVNGEHLSPNDFVAPTSATLKNTAYGLDITGDGTVLYTTDQHRVRVAGVDTDGDNLPDAAEAHFGTSPSDTDSDEDGNLDAPATLHYQANPDSSRDNCPDVSNSAQTNSDGNFIDLPPSKPWDDTSRAMSDAQGDACDPDDDNDGRSDNAESTDSDGCGSTSSPTNNDTDGDLVLDNAECLLGYDPDDSASTPPWNLGPDSDSDGLPNDLDPNDADADSDDDGLIDGLEFRSYGTNVLSFRSDGDVCRDGKEVGSVNNGDAVNSVDIAQITFHKGAVRVNPPSGAPEYIADFDIDKDGDIDQSDVDLAATFFGPC